MDLGSYYHAAAFLQTKVGFVNRTFIIRPDIRHWEVTRCMPTQEVSMERLQQFRQAGSRQSQWGGAVLRL